MIGEICVNRFVVHRLGGKIAGMAATSRKMPAWSAEAADEESRAYLFDKAGFALSPAGIDGVPELSDPSLRGYLDSHDDEVAGAV